MNILTLIVFGILVTGLLIGTVKIIAKQVLSVIIALFAVVCAYFYSPAICDFIKNKTGVDDYVRAKVSSIVDGDIENKVKYDYYMETGQDAEALDPQTLATLKNKAYSIDPKKTARVNILKYVGFPEDLTEVMINNVSRYDTMYIEANSFSDYVSIYMVDRLLLMIANFVIFIFIITAFHAGMTVLEKSPGVVTGYVNKAGGAVLGGFISLMIIWFVFMVLKDGKSETCIEAVKQINSSTILSFIQENNVVATFFTGVENHINGMIEIVQAFIQMPA